MAVTDLMSSLGSSTDSPERLQEKANRALTGKHKQELGLDLNQPVDFEEVYAVPELEKVTVEELKILYPVKVAGKVLEQAAEILNTATEDMDYVMAKEFRDNCLSFIDILKNSKSRVSFADYVNACKFATFKLAGNTDVRAYALTFPDRIRRMERDKVPNSHLYQYASIYSKNKTVVEVMAKLVVPTHIMFQDIFHQAVKVQSELMLNDKISPKVRSDAANSLMTHLKTPEVKQAELKVDVQGSGAIEQLAEALGSLSGKQSEMLREGRYSLRDIREATIIEVTPDD